MVDVAKVPAARSSLDVEATSQLAAWIDAGWKRDEGLRRRWDYWRDMLVGEFRRQGMDAGALKEAGVDLDKMTINLVYLHARTLLPSLFAQDPYVDALPPTDADAPNAPVWEGLINHTIPLIKYKREVKRAVMDAIVFGEGWHKWGWSGRARPSERSRVPDAVAPAAYQRAPATDFISQALSLAGYQVGEPIGGGPKPSSRGRRIDPSTGESGADPVSWLLKDGPFCVRMAPHSVVVDPLSPDRDPLTARFIAIRYLKPLSEVRATPGYNLPAGFTKLRDKPGLLNTSGSAFNYAPWSMRGERSSLDTMGSLESPERLGLVVLWEVWAYRLVDLGLYRQVVTLIEGVERPIRMVSWEDLLGTDGGGYPIHRLAFNEVPDEPPMSEFEAWAPMQDMLNWLVRKALANVNRFPRQTLMNPKALMNPAVSKALLEKGTDGAVHECKGSLADVIAPVDYPSASTNDASQLVSFLWDAVQAISGISENRKGQAAARTATEAKIIEGGSAVREQEKQTAVQDFCEEGLYTLLTFFQSFVDRDYVIRRVGSGGAIQWLKFGPAQLSGEIPSIKIRFESTKFSNEQKNLQKWSAAMTWLAQMKPLIPNLRLDLALGYALRALGIENVAELIGSPLTPMQREQQWLEIAQMMMGIPMPVNPAESHALHMEVNQEFRGTPAYAAMAQDPTKQMALQLFEMHDQMHQQELAKIQAQTTEVGGELPPDAPTGNEESPANQGRGAAQEFMPEMPAMAGGSNEL